MLHYHDAGLALGQHWVNVSCLQSKASRLNLLYGTTLILSKHVKKCKKLKKMV